MQFHRQVVVALALFAALVGSAPSRVTADQTGAPPNETEHWWGGMGAVMCGIGLRELGFTIANPGWLAATIGGCALAVIDAIAD